MVVVSRMAKSSYRWRYSLDASRLDVSLAFKSSNGVGIRPVPVRLVVAVLASFLGGFLVIQVSPLMNMGIGWVILFVIFWLAASAVLLKPDATGHLAFEQLPVLINYLPRSSRRVVTRSSAPAWAALSVIGIADIDEETGLITFRDGRVGRLYRVVGSASTLLFPSDRDAIIDRVNSFYMKMRTEYEITFVTMREAQKVDRQMRALDARIRNMRGNPDLDELRELAESERDVLRYQVGRKRKSLHQYMIITASSVEKLDMGVAAVSAEVENSQLMFKRVQALFDTDDDGKRTWELTDTLRSIYGALPREARLVHASARKEAADGR